MAWIPLAVSMYASLSSPISCLGVRSEVNRYGFQHVVGNYAMLLSAFVAAFLFVEFSHRLNLFTVFGSKTGSDPVSCPAFDWSYARFPDGPYDRDNNQVVLIADENYNHRSICADWQYPPGGTHSADPLTGPMRESNRLHTDGHVETVRAPFEQAVVRWGEFHRPF